MGYLLIHKMQSIIIKLDTTTEKLVFQDLLTTVLVSTSFFFQASLKRKNQMFISYAEHPERRKLIRILEAMLENIRAEEKRNTLIAYNYQNQRKGKSSVDYLTLSHRFYL